MLTPPDERASRFHARAQGFTRPKVLLLLPTRHRAFRAVQRLLKLAPAAQGRADSVVNWDRFQSEFGPDDDDDSEEEGGGKGGRKGRPPPPKPADHVALFRGNVDDHFRLGIKMTRRQVRRRSRLLSRERLAPRMVSVLPA